MSDLSIGGNGARKVGHFRAWNFGDKDLAAFHLLDAIHHKADTLIEGKPEACHAVIGDGDLAARNVV